ncbi:efflux RND transporter permease subunit [Tanticharoenia sakaeratensis]|uniref:Cation efflux system protein CzcA n=1 Tax=Tanticharoenia sakaeratensis NBRC 103193 TaxID=1231623 RepID=A0A0D6MR61_9PROT|nr:CusA/CzcA family heavy metal efflux RND transporter [Tanticharoenia sakaeratensis]GAN55763.1 cation efflux system protein CzcA [Tanticharoenia sakaeratensis NBRC 103193]GBQ18572.1 cation efflux system protein CzcA [Tanticharoenia sakaeratensis NBRC 103193]
MIERAIAWCFGRRKVVFFAAILLALCGYAAWQGLPVEAYPDLGAPNVLVTTQVPGLAAEEIEQQITTPLERALASVPGVVDSRSSSTFGLSLVTLIFSDKTSIYLARQLTNEAIAQATLPAGITPTLGPISGPAGEIYRYTLESDRQNLMQLSDIQRWTVIPALQQIQGVVNVNNFGGFTKEYQLVVDPKALQRYNVGVNDVINAIKNNSVDAGGGRITRGEQSYIVRGIGMVHSLDDLGAIGVTQHNGTPVMLRDLGQIQFGHQVREGVLGKDHNPDTIEGIVTMLTGDNPSLVLDHIHETVQRLQKQLDPMGVHIVPYIDRDNLVHATTNKVGETMVEGIGLVLLILTIFLGSPRSALVTAVTIPLALSMVFVLMRVLGMSANLFSLGAIDFGVIVDGAIVVTEAILRIREHYADRALRPDEVLTVARQAGRSIFSSTLIIIVAYSPLFAFEGSEGKLFRPMAFTVSFALLGALACAIMLIPTLSFIALRKPQRLWHNAPLEWLHHRYRFVLGHMIDRPAVAYAGGVIALVLVVGLGMSVGREFLPDLDEGALWIQVQMPSGISVDAGSAIADRLRDTVREFPETSYAITQLGRNDDGTDPWSPSHIEMPVGLTPYSSWPAGESKAQFVNRLRARLSMIPGISFGISQPIEDNMSDLVGGAHSPLVLRVYGNDLDELRRIGGDIVDVLHAVPGTAEASIFQEPRIPQLGITADRAAAARYGVSVSDIANVVQNAIGDAAITQVYVQDRVYNATIHIARMEARNLQAIEQLPLLDPQGAQIPLGQVAKIALRTGESNIAHELYRRQITIRVDNGERPLSQYLADAQARIENQVHYDHRQFHLEWAGTFQQEQRAQERLSIALLVMLAVMVVLLFIEFGTVRHALLVLSVVPLATLGGLVALHLRGETLNIATAVGFIALFGVAVQNGIIMIANINRHRADGVPVREAVLEGAGERFRPVLMTATVATAGMLPAALATGIGTDVQRGLATVVVGGLGIATLLTLFALPTYFCELEMRVQRRLARTRSADRP